MACSSVNFRPEYETGGKKRSLTRINRIGLGEGPKGENVVDAGQESPTLHDHPAVRRVRAALEAAGVAPHITVMREATHTAQAAAEALGITVAEIAKSIIFKAADQRAVLVITSGANRVDRKKVEAAIGQAVGKADADFVRAATGFVIGGVAPVAHEEPPVVLMDRDLLKFAAVWPAAGHPNTMFRIAPDQLQRASRATLADVAERPEEI
ncbi:MAG: YbaK/EbsC family protein [Betaproteobacteria bacterium]|nr:YbaK/EbsC family protein [Betaproteobacteria bacterium]